MSKKSLFNDASDEEEALELKTNESYARSYNQFRKKELLSHLKNKDLEQETSSSEDDLSTDEEVVNPEFDKEFFKTLAYLKSQDPTKYEVKPKFFDKTKTVEGFIKEKYQKKEKPVTIKDYKRDLLLKHGADFVEEDIVTEQPGQSVESPTYVEEQEQLRQALKNAIKDSESEDEEVLGGILQKRDKTKEDLQKEEEEYLLWLAGQKQEVEDDAKKELKPLKEFWSSNNLSKDDQFLRDYILNKRYIANESIPTYDEIVGTLSDDEQELERQEQFEYKYNYRFEDPDKEFLKRFPRTIPDSVRAVDNKRKEKRKEREERKAQEKLLKKRELDELNKLRKQELQEKLERLKEVAQNENFCLNEADLESDFDPDEHDRRMKETFNDDYYMINEGEQKPEFPNLDQELDIEDWDNFNPENVEKNNQEEAPHCEDEDFNMDLDYDPEQVKAEKSKKLQDELIDSTRSKRKKKKRVSKLAEIIKVNKPVYDPNDEKTYDQYLDEYYKLDYEDIIGDTPCRFKYVETTPNDFGLTVEEILMASNKELNQWASLKKTMQNRPKQVEMNDYYMYKKRAQNEALKRKIFKSIYGAPEDEQLDDNIRTEVEPIASVQVSEPPAIKEPKRKKKKLMKLQDNLETEQANIDEKVSIKNTKIQQIVPMKIAQIEKKKNKKKETVEPSEPGKFIKIQKAVISDKNKNKMEKPHNKILQGVKKHKKPICKDGKKEFLPKHRFKNGNEASDISENRLRAFGINPKRFYNKIKYGPNSQNNSGSSSKTKFKHTKKTQK